MKALSSLALAAMLIAAPAFAADQHGNGKHPQKKAKNLVKDHDPAGVSGSVHIQFSTAEVRVIREHYSTRYRSLPPGLKKKYQRTGQLPPGWQKKMQPFPARLERELVVLPAGYGRGVIDGHAVIYNPRTQVIVDVAVLF